MSRVARIGLAMALLASLLASTTGCSGRPAQGPVPHRRTRPDLRRQPLELRSADRCTGRAELRERCQLAGNSSRETKKVDVFYLSDTTYAKPDPTSRTRGQSMTRR